MLSLTTFLYKTIDPVFNVGPENWINEPCHLYKVLTHVGIYEVKNVTRTNDLNVCMRIG